jgi:oxygen-independent coproporphyrinogen-3 oxidase
MKLSLLEKYDKPTPRYTSYPTVPYWETAPTQEEWLTLVHKRTAETPEISVYIHLPYCEQLCTYCGCNKRITVNHAVEKPYVESLLAEWKVYLDHFARKPVLKELHLGGGTPTFFSPENLDDFLGRMLATVEVPEDHAYSFEAHPNNTTIDHLRILNNNGFNRISIGVQDLSPVIMSAINRQQSEAEVFRLTESARRLNYESVNFDLVYGLPFQRLQHIEYNLEKLAELMPDRVAYYSYAHVPWKQAGQRKFTEADIPIGVDKRALYETAGKGLEQLGYHAIGMDHFALSTEALHRSAAEGTMHRNFMGYTPYPTTLLIGLGTSAISDGGEAFVQNATKVEDYRDGVSTGQLPIFRGHQLHTDDQLLRSHILNIMCRFGTSWNADELKSTPSLERAYLRLQQMVKDGLVKLNGNSVSVTPTGAPFIRNIAQCFDDRYWRRRPTESVFSGTL